MKSILLIVMVFCSVAAVGQRKLVEDDPHWRQQTVQRAFNEVSVGMRVSWSERWLARLGDSAAPEIMKILESKRATNKDAETALTIVNMSFADPSLIRRAQDRAPANTLVLLDYLDKHTSDDGTKSAISSLREKLRAQSPVAEQKSNN